jgi:UDP-N-acetyl-D-glucosamine dehydrogenase
MDMLAAHGARVAYHDPHVPVIRKNREHPHWAGTRSVPLTPAALRKYDAVLIATHHRAVDYTLLARHARLIVDTRNAMAGCRTRPGQVWKA